VGSTFAFFSSSSLFTECSMPTPAVRMPRVPRLLYKLPRVSISIAPQLFLVGLLRCQFGTPFQVSLLFFLSIRGFSILNMSADDTCSYSDCQLYSIYPFRCSVFWSRCDNFSFLGLRSTFSRSFTKCPVSANHVITQRHSDNLRPSPDPLPLSGGTAFF